MYDALIYMSGYSSEEINEVLNDQMMEVDKWLKVNKLILNANKTKVMLIKSVRKKTIGKLNIKWLNQILEEVDEIKYLGVIIDKNLNFTC